MCFLAQTGIFHLFPIQLGISLGRKATSARTRVPITFVDASTCSQATCPGWASLQTLSDESHGPVDVGLHNASRVYDEGSFVRPCVGNLADVVMFVQRYLPYGVSVFINFILTFTKPKAFVNNILWIDFERRNCTYDWKTAKCVLFLVNYLNIARLNTCSFFLLIRPPRKRVPTLK